LNMIAYLKGTVQNKGKGYLILNVHDVGYKLFVTPDLYTAYEIGQPAEFYTYQRPREDGLDLYAFRSLEALEMFELLLSVSGIGPKSAQGVLSIASVNDIKQSIAYDDSSILTKVSGVGKKTAERVVLELKSKIGAVELSSHETTSGRVSGDEIDALVALGYSQDQAREALRQAGSDTTDSSQRIKEALRRIGK